MPPKATTENLEGSSITSEKPHSVDQICDTRLKWWRSLHLQSIFREEKITAPASALDVGVGSGHWTVSLFSAFPDDGIKIVGLDIEDHWVEKSIDYVAKNLPAHQFLAERGNAYDIKFSADSFDMVTCQTMLMHLDTPEQALREMCRVLRPGGMLLISEPMNQLNMSLASSLIAVGDPDLGQTIWSFWQAYHAKLSQLGYGNHDIAARLPGLIQAIDSIGNINAYHSDMVSFQGPDRLSFSGLLDYLGTDQKSQEVLAALKKGKFREFKDALKQLETVLVARGETVACPQQNMLFVARKNS